MSLIMHFILSQSKNDLRSETSRFEIEGHIKKKKRYMMSEMHPPKRLDMASSNYEREQKVDHSQCSYLVEKETKVVNAYNNIAWDIRNNRPAG